jgi:ABC-type multidrug transport system ATPase subunit
VYIQQEDLLFAQLTVQETLETSAALREKQDIHSLESPTATVDSLILNLGLKKSKDTPVGDAKTRGLSGGEKVS